VGDDNVWTNTPCGLPSDLLALSISRVVRKLQDATFPALERPASESCKADVRVSRFADVRCGNSTRQTVLDPAETLTVV